MKRLLVAFPAFALLAILGTANANPPDSIPPAIYTDPPHDAENPARMEVLHIQSGVQTIYGVAYIAAGPGPHPTVVLCHGWPGNEKNLDLAQAMRRAGWNVVTFNYRGSWGSPGTFSFSQNPEDAQAVLAHIRDSENGQKLAVDPSQIVLMGHSMGGWVTAMVAAKDPELKGAVMISPGNMGALANLPYEQVYGFAAGSSETLAGASAQSLTAELVARKDYFDLRNHASGMAEIPMLILTSDDGLTASTNDFADAVSEAGNGQVTKVHAATDHSWSDRRIELASVIINWLERLN